MCKNRSGKENEIYLKQNKVYGSKDRQRKERRYFRTSENRENSNNQEIQILRSYNKWRGKPKRVHSWIKTKVWANK